MVWTKNMVADGYSIKKTDLLGEARQMSILLTFWEWGILCFIKSKTEIWYPLNHLAWFLHMIKFEGSVK